MENMIPRFFKFTVAGKNLCNVKVMWVGDWLYIFLCIWECESHCIALLWFKVHILPWKGCPNHVITMLVHKD